MASTGSTAALERLPDALEATVGECDDLEAHLEPFQLRMRGEPGLGGTAQAALLLGGHHLERVAVPTPTLRLHLDEREPPAPAHHEVELIAADPDVRLQDPVAAQAVEPPGATLRRATRGERARSGCGVPQNGSTGQFRRAHGPSPHALTAASQAMPRRRGSGSRAPGTSAGGYRRGRSRGRPRSAAA